jgi:nicotinamidase-related amidase
MRALIIIDVQNEFSSQGLRPVVDHEAALAAISRHVTAARGEATPIAWVRHHNKPNESPAFIPGSWGAEFSHGFGPLGGAVLEKEFFKNVYGAFTGTDLGSWLSGLGVREILIVGFYTHGCVSTTSREAIMAGLDVQLDPEATGTCDIEHPVLGKLAAGEVRRSALLQLVNMGARLSTRAHAMSENNSQADPI